MGVPKFFRCISERYPCISELVKEFQIPDFDNLYLDMNGIIHACSHPYDFDPHFSITEEKIFASIFHYIEVLFNMIKPKKLFFLAVDGVAPRAKMNQQRARRFRSAKEAEVKYKEALKKGEKPLPKESFDSNCITPGTVFMDRLHSQLQYFITSKISMDPIWQGCKIILSGHQTPGEGEHKIMDYIRYLKTLPDYDDNTRHCLYGLDADLIMLGMCTHEPHFSLLREKVLFSKRHRKGIASPDETEFYLLHLSLLREYLDLEFQEFKETLPFQYNLENIIDDWILMGFLIGNDFIPNLPDLHLSKGAFPVLFKAYKEVLPTLDGYLNENGYLNLPRFQKYMEKMAHHDLESFEDTFANLAFLEEKTGKSFFSGKANGETGKNPELEELIKATEEEISDDESLDEDLEENDTFLWEFCQHKKNYYTDKLDFSKVTPEVLASQAEGYVRAIQWNLHYYYQGCQSWSWYYPHHYAPYISDIRNFKDFKLDFEMGKPFLPFEQLLAVLPPASQHLLPEVYRDLMTSPNSPIKDFYPENFETDLNGKEQDWEAVVLIPFIDEKRLLEAMAPYNDKLTEEELKRNRHGPMHVFTYTNENLGIYKSLGYFPSIPSNHALKKDVYREEIAVGNSDLTFGLRPRVLLDVKFPEFPTFKHIPHTASLKPSKVKVFEHPSRGDNMILTLKKQECPILKVLAEKILGKIIYINWPYLRESRVVAVSNREIKYYLTEEESINCEVFDKTMQLQWAGEGDSLTRQYLEKMGVEIGEVEVIIHVLVLEGWKYIFGPKGKILTEKIWCTTSSPCALQVVVLDVQACGRRTQRYNDFTDAFPVNSVVFMLGQPHFGSKGRVLDSTECSKKGRLKVELEVHEDPVISESLMKFEPKNAYLPCKVAALKVGIGSHLLSRITGSILVSMTKEEGLNNPGSKINIGLNLKFSKKNEEVPGYTKRERDNNWSYSIKAVALVDAYVKKFSNVVEFLSSHQTTNIFFVQDIFPGPEGVTEMKEMVAWIKAQEYNQVGRSKCGTTVLGPHVLSKLVEITDSTSKKVFTRHMQVKPHLLYKSDLVFGNVPPIKYVKHKMLDRVVSIRFLHTVPAGFRGFIVGIHPAPLEADFLYDVLFDEPFVGGLKVNLSSEKCFKMSSASFLNISDAKRRYQRSTSGLVPTNVCWTPYSNEPKASAFAQWSHQPSAEGNDEEFRKMWSNLQTAKPQEDALKKLLRIEKKENEEVEDPVKLFFEKITKASNGSSKTPERTSAPLRDDSHLTNRFYLQLCSEYQKRGLGQPKFKYLQVGGKVMAQAILNDGKVYSGLPCDGRESACESAALQALGALGEFPLNNEIFARNEREKIIESQIRLSNALTNPKGANRNKPPQTTHRANNKKPPLLPDPPSQWMGHAKNSPLQRFPFYPPRDSCSVVSKKGIQEQNRQISYNSSKKKLDASALEFVPLQVITGKRNFRKTVTTQSPKQVKESQKKTEIVATFINNAETSTTTVKPKRMPKIAAKLNFDPNLY